MCIENLKKAVELAGGQTKLAQRIGGRVRQQHVHLWLKSGVSPDYVIAVSRAVQFSITPHDLRPDIYPHPEDGLPRGDELRTA